MGKLCIPFVFGPVAGGERAPWSLRYSFGFKGWILDLIRDCANFIVRIDPFMWETFYKADQIFVTSEQTLRLLPKRFRKKAQIHLAVGIERPNTFAAKKPIKTFRVLYAGRFLYLKGMQLGIRAFARLLESVPDALLTMVGDGPDKKRWKSIALKHGIEDKIDWFPWVEQGELFKLYCQHDVFLFPSLHDSGGQVVLEAMAWGLPIVCLDIGGPKLIVDRTCGYKVPVKDLSEEEIVGLIYEALSKLAKNEMRKTELSIGAINRTNKFTWTSLADTVYTDMQPIGKRSI